MSNLLKADIAKGTPNTALNALTEDGAVKIAWDGKSKLRIEHDLDSGAWATIFEGFPPAPAGPALVVDYVGTALRISNLGPADTTKVKVSDT